MSTSVSFQQNVGGYMGEIDAFIRQSRPTSSYTSLPYVDADGADSAGAIIQGLLYFSKLFGTEAGQIPTGAVITSATLTFRVSDSTREGVNLYSMVQDWTSKSSWTWNSFGNGIQTDGIEASVNPVLSLAGLAKGVQTLDVTKSLQDWASGATPNYGWLLTSLGTDGYRFSGSKSTEAPILNVTYEIPTTPLPGLVVAQTGGSTIVTEGGSGDTFSIALRAAPTSDVTIQIATTGASDISVPIATVTFTAANWNVAQTISLGAINDTAIEGNETFSLTLAASSAGSDYNGRTSNLTVTVVDNDAPPALKPAVVAVHDLTKWQAGDPSGYGSGDPSGIAYVPGLNRLFIVDSEHDESPYFSSVNMFSASLNGTSVQSYSMLSYTKEPTGLCYNPKNGLLYATDDDARALLITNPSDPTVRVGRIDLRPLGILDAEDPAIDPRTGNILLLDGTARTLFELSPTGSLIKKTVLPSAIADAEAMAYDPTADVFYFAGGATRGTIFETDRSGNIIETFTLLNSFTNPISDTKPRIKGLELAPSSDPNDGNKMSLYAVDYGKDQVADGRLFEINLHSDLLLA